MRYSMLLNVLVASVCYLETVKADQPKKPAARIKIFKTKQGFRFGLLGAKATAPAPTLFVFGGDIENTLRKSDYNQVGQRLAKDGYLCVSLDVPCHGADAKDKDDLGLAGWRRRLEKGDKLVAGFTARASRVLDYLIKEKYTDPKRVGVCGTSRGGFMALHFAAADSRVKCVAAFAPVTNLLALSEFDGMQNQAAARKVSLLNSADKLVNQTIWICIGNNDLRVSTDDVIAFSRKVVKIAAERSKPANVELHVMAVVGHRIHGSAHAEVAVWMLKQMKKVK
jgi:dienelactone hydrolase